MMIAVIEDTPAGPALLVHGVRVAEKPVGDTTLQALADQINAAAGWRDIQSAPRNGTTVLLTRTGSPPVCSGHYRQAPIFLNGERMWVGCVIKEPTHWMPLPEPPDGV